MCVGSTVILFIFICSVQVAAEIVTHYVRIILLQCSSSGSENRNDGMMADQMEILQENLST